jgi:hypothetical protein
MPITEAGCKDVDWIHLAQDRDRWRAPVNIKINLLFAYVKGNFWAN